jgi:choline dehydrogenase
VDPAGADVVIVGAGAAGCVVARRLADRGRSVLLLDAGPDLGRDVRPALLDGWRNPLGADWTTDWGFETEPDDSGSTTKPDAASSSAGRHG